MTAASGDSTALAKETKAQLKQARDLINQKDHSGALKLCEVRQCLFQQQPNLFNINKFC